MQESEYKGVKQGWCMMFSQQAYQREVATLEKKLSKQETLAKKALMWSRCSTWAQEVYQGAQVSRSLGEAGIDVRY